MMENRDHVSGKAARLPVLHYDVTFIPNPMRHGITNDEALSDFVSARNRLVYILAPTVTIGPSGNAFIATLPDGDSFIDFESGPNVYSIYLSEDLLSLDRYLYVEFVSATAVNSNVFDKFVEAIEALDGWAISIGGMRDGYVIVFSDRICVRGKPFASANTLSEVVQIVASNLHPI